MRHMTQPESSRDLTTEPGKRLAILQVVLTMGETSAPYNEHCLAMRDQREITICTYFKPTVPLAKGLTLFAGDDTLPGFFRALNQALAVRDYDIVHAHSVHVACLLVLAGVFHPKPVLASAVYTLHSSYPNYKLRNRLMLIPALALFRKSVCCSYASRDSFPAFFKWLAGNRLSVVQNGTDIRRVDQALAAYPARPRSGDFTIATVGRLMDIKNPFVILSAFRQANDPASRLKFIGDGPLRSALLTECATHGLGERVELTGLIPRDVVYSHVRDADVFVSASQVEGLPVAVIEAMACRCPVILSDIEPHREIVGEADFVPLVRLGDVDGFAQALQTFRRMSVAERQSVGEKCRRLVEARFSLTAMHRGYDAVYAQVVGPTPSREAVM